MSEIFVGSGDPLFPGQWYQSDTYYQILEVKPSSQERKNRKGGNISTSVLARKRGTGDTSKSEPCSFDDFELDLDTVKKLKDYPKKGDNNKLSSYLPLPGVVFPDGFIDKTLSNANSNQTELGNFYASIRVILQSRKLSQLIARTWWTYLEAKKTDLWYKFTAGEWDDIPSQILDGLIAREIFLVAGGSPPENPDPEDPNIYVPLKSKDATDKGARFLILPTSKAWQGIALSLLSSGQAYYLNKKENKYHQVAESVLSTGEIVFNYSLESDWSIFQGQFKELIISEQSPWMVYQVVMPYPPIPSSEQLDANDIKKWAEAEEDGGDFSFYKKRDGAYLMDVDYFRSPYPYIPLSTS